MRDIGGGPGRGLGQGRRLLFGRVDGVAAGVLQTLLLTLRSGIGALQTVLALLNAVEERDLDFDFHVVGLP